MKVIGAVIAFILFVPVNNVRAGGGTGMVSNVSKIKTQYNCGYTSPTPTAKKVVTIPTAVATFSPRLKNQSGNNFDFKKMFWLSPLIFVLGYFYLRRNK